MIPSPQTFDVVPQLRSILDTPAEAVDDQVQALQSQIISLNAEIEALRKRDETVKFYMQRLDEEMRLAARLQQDFLPKTLPQLGSVHFHALFRPAGYVSGDLYDVMRLDESHVGFYMADAVGHGMPAALLTMFIKNALVTKQINPEGYRLLTAGETMAELNRVLIQQDLSYATFATAVYGRIDTNTLEMTFARGGHPNPILLGADGSTRTLAADGGLLGIFPEETFSTSTVQLKPGDRLFIFSDGIEVAFSEDLQSPDAQSWKNEIQKRRKLSGQEIVASLAAHLDSESGSLAPKDDLTLIVAEVQ
ncbi:MAG TPA: PP2C family protein-serine/threonine phosphatase [Tepidisphaeraceae bacterium]|nr:PP2C family protein-serine/threonine phosphatase [Tepidisphaeraceae bacterium]